jgi:hypothetical protein
MQGLLRDADKDERCRPDNDEACNGNQYLT